MTRTIARMLKGALLAGAIAGCLAASPAQAQIQVRINTPPAWYIATTRPVYHDGHASYWYGNRWHYREGRSWRQYREEPRYLRDHRRSHRSDRYRYDRDRDGGYRRDRDGGRDHGRR